MEEKSRLEQFRELAEMDPEDPVVHYGLGSECLKAKLFDEAVRAFRRAIELKLDYSAAYRELGKALEGAGQREEAIAAYHKGKEVAGKTGDLQTGKEMDVFLRRLKAD